MVTLIDYYKWVLALIVFIVSHYLIASIEFATDKCDIDPAIQRFIYISQYTSNAIVRLRWSKEFEDFEYGPSVSFTLYTNLVNELRFTLIRPPPQCVKRLGTKFPYIYADIIYGERNCRIPLLFTDDWHFADFLDTGKDKIPPRERLKHGMGPISDADVFISQKRKYFSFYRPNLIFNESSEHWQRGEREFEHPCQPVTRPDAAEAQFHKMKLTVSRFHGSDGEPLRNLPPNCRIELKFSSEFYLFANHIQPPPPITTTQAPTTPSTTTITCPTLPPPTSTSATTTTTAQTPPAIDAEKTMGPKSKNKKSASRMNETSKHQKTRSPPATTPIPPSALPLAMAVRDYTTLELAIFTVIVVSGFTLAVVLYAWFAYIAVLYFKAKDRELLHPDELFGGEIDDDLEDMEEIIQIVDASSKARKNKKSEKSTKKRPAQNTNKK